MRNLHEIGKFDWDWFNRPYVLSKKEKRKIMLRKGLLTFICLTAIIVPIIVLAIGMIVYLGPDVVSTHPNPTPYVATITEHTRDSGIPFLAIGVPGIIFGIIIAVMIASEELR